MIRRTACRNFMNEKSNSSASESNQSAILTPKEPCSILGSRTGKSALGLSTSGLRLALWCGPCAQISSSMNSGGNISMIQKIQGWEYTISATKRNTAAGKEERDSQVGAFCRDRLPGRRTGQSPAAVSPFFSLLYVANSFGDVSRCASLV